MLAKHDVMPARRVEGAGLPAFVAYCLEQSEGLLGVGHGVGVAGLLVPDRADGQVSCRQSHPDKPRCLVELISGYALPLTS